MSGRPKIKIDDVELEWDPEHGTMRVSGAPAVCMAIETRMAGLMKSLQEMVGTERFRLAAEQLGREIAEAEWQDVILKHPTIEEGIAWRGKAAGVVGLGRFEIVSMDWEKKEARFRVLNGWEAIYQRALGVVWGSSMVAGRLAGYCTKAFGVYCRAEQVSFLAKGDAYDEFVVRPSEVTLEAELEALIRTDNATRADLDAALERLRNEVEERKRAEDDLRREAAERAEMEQVVRGKLNVIRQQEEAIWAMSTPILRLWDGVLGMPVIGLVDRARAGRMMESLLAEITRTNAHFAILDLTGVEVIDTPAASYVLQLIRAARLLGTRCLISGITPAIASTVVGLGINLSELMAFGTLESALRYAIGWG